MACGKKWCLLNYDNDDNNEINQYNHYNILEPIINSEEIIRIWMPAIVSLGWKL